jgi:hypothetical protein
MHWANMSFVLFSTASITNTTRSDKYRATYMQVWLEFLEERRPVLQRMTHSLIWFDFQQKCIASTKATEAANNKFHEYFSAVFELFTEDGWKQRVLIGVRQGIQMRLQ